MALPWLLGSMKLDTRWTKRILRRVVVATAVISGLGISVGVGPAAAAPCTCGEPPATGLRERVTASVVAFAGRVTASTTSGTWQTVTYDVEQVVWGGARHSVVVLVDVSDPTCAVTTPPGELVGVLLDIDPEYGDLVSSSCQAMLDPAELTDPALLAMQPDPGAGPPVAWATGRYDTAQVVALDRDGRTAGFATGRPRVAELAPCPGGGRVVARDDTGLSVLDSTSLEEVARVDVPAFAEIDVYSSSTVEALRCTATDGSAVRWLRTVVIESHQVLVGTFRGGVVREDPLPAITVGPADIGPEGRTGVVSVLRPEGDGFRCAVQVVDLETRAVTHELDVEDCPSRMDIDPSGTRLAVSRFSGSPPARTIKTEVWRLAADGHLVREADLPLDDVVVVDLEWSSVDAVVALGYRSPTHQDTFVREVRRDGTVLRHVDVAGARRVALAGDVMFAAPGVLRIDAGGGTSNPLVAPDLYGMAGVPLPPAPAPPLPLPLPIVSPRFTG